MTKNYETEVHCHVIDCPYEKNIRTHFVHYASHYSNLCWHIYDFESIMIVFTLHRSTGNSKVLLNGTHQVRARELWALQLQLHRVRCLLIQGSSLPSHNALTHTRLIINHGMYRTSPWSIFHSVLSRVGIISSFGCCRGRLLFSERMLWRREKIFWCDGQ